MDIVNTPLTAAPVAASHLNKAALCTRLGVSARTLENMVRGGKFPPGVRVGKFLYWNEISVAAWHKRMFGPQDLWRPK